MKYYEAPNDLTKEDFISVFNNGVLNEADLLLLGYHYQMQNHTATATDLAPLVGYARYSAVNLHYWRIAKKIAAFTEKYPEKWWEDGKYRWWSLLFTGEARGNNFLAKLRPILVDAIQELNLFKEGDDDELNLGNEIFRGNNADTLDGILELETKMKTLVPTVKERVSRYIERGQIANKVKKVTGFKCLVCEGLGINPYSFKKSDGEFYVETHHVEPVSKAKQGSLSLSNLITVCANHHRQLHYGDVEVSQNNESFIFKIDGNEVIIKKIVLPVSTK